MNGIGELSVREGRFDVAIVAGPRVSLWPSAGLRALSTLCAEMGLEVGLFGGESISVKGVIPLPGTGGIVLLEDVQKRIHRIHARAIVKVTQNACLPDSFSGWRSQGLIPLFTAERLRKESRVQWDPATAILGTGNEALRFGISLLESGVGEVYCIESFAQWGAKRFAGWEVEKRRFESLGGRLLEAKPVKLSPKAALLWELRIQDARGLRILEVARVVSAGPFRDLAGIREHPPGSSLFELEQTARASQVEDVEGWVLEETRCRWLAGKIVKGLATDLQEHRDKKDEIERVFKRARMKLKNFFHHREEPFVPAYQGKWVASTDFKAIRAFSGTPQTEQKKRLVASVECFEQIACKVCMTICPHGAIEIGRIPREAAILNESKCVGCGLCVQACPSGAITMLQENSEHAMSTLVLPWRGVRPWKEGEFAVAVNRRGERMGGVRVLKILEAPSDRVHETLNDGSDEVVSQLVQVDIPTHLLWEARSVKRARTASVEDEIFMKAVSRSELSAEKVDITLDGERRMVREKIPVTVALFETGQSRPEDVLYCPDGSCGLCQVTVDGVQKLACQEKVHRGMAIRLTESPAPTQGENSLCPCLGITVEQVVERLKNGSLQSPEAVLSVTHVGEGKCHGQLCLEAFRRTLLDQGLDASQWSDWRFPWSEWTVTHS